MWQKAGVLDPDNRFDLGQLDHELSRPALRVVGHQWESRRTAQLVEVVPRAREIGGDLRPDQWRHPQADLHAQSLVPTQQLDRLAQVGRQAGDDQRPPVNGPQRRPHQCFQFIDRQGLDLTGSAPDGDHLHTVLDLKLEIAFEAGQVQMQQVVGKRRCGVGVYGLEPIAEFCVVRH